MSYLEQILVAPIYYSELEEAGSWKKGFYLKDTDIEYKKVFFFFFKKYLLWNRKAPVCLDYHIIYYLSYK